MENQQNSSITDRISERMGDLKNSIQEGITPIVSSVNDNIEKLNENVSNIRENVGTTLNDFSTKSAVDANANSEYLNSNTIIAKFAFIILILILFVFLFNLGVKLIAYFTSPSKSPYIVKGLISGANGMVISQDPNSSTSVTVQRSNNNKTGIEFTWSVWLYVSPNPTSKHKYLHVFNKGDSNWDSEGVSTINNGPGLYLTNKLGDGGMGLHIVMDTENVDTAETSKQIIDINEIPIQKWFNVCIRLENVIMDVYVNGTNSGRIIMPYVPRQNYNDINVCQQGGFSGNLSNLRYFDHALSVYEINSLIWSGPNLTANSSSDIVSGTTYSKGTNFMSNMWYSNKW